MGKPTTIRRRRGSGQKSPPPRTQSEAVRRGGFLHWVIAGGCLLLLAAGITMWALAGHAAEAIRYEVVHEYPHDVTAYCQGLVVDEGVLYEGTGRYGLSSLRRVELETGTPRQQIQLDPNLFGEGITVWQDQLIQLTWKKGLGIIYDKKSFKELKRFTYVGEGWGLTHDGEHWIMSDGSATLRYIDPQTQQVTRRLKVRNRKFPVRQLNELEYIRGEIFANVFMRDYIVRISPRNGQVTGVLDLSPLHPRRNRRSSEEVLNGIAYDAAADRIYVTGKNWPKLYEIRILP